MYHSELPDNTICKAGPRQSEAPFLGYRRESPLAWQGKANRYCGFMYCCKPKAAAGAESICHMQAAMMNWGKQSAFDMFSNLMTFQALASQQGQAQAAAPDRAAAPAAPLPPRAGAA